MREQEKQNNNPSVSNELYGAEGEKANQKFYNCRKKTVIEKESSFHLRGANHV